jgi:hypothetical protein
MRFDDKWNQVQKLAFKLRQEVTNYSTNVTLTSLLPIENESRKLPKTGYFRGKPFSGSWAERSAAVEIFNNILESTNFQVYKHPKAFYNEKNELTFDVMERPQSVHISPMHYRWNLDENKERYGSN